MVPLTSSVSGLWRGGMKGMLCQWFKTIMSALLSRFLFQKSRKWQLFFKTDNHNKKIFSRFCVELQCFSISFPSFSRLYLSFVVDDAITGIRKSLAEWFDIRGMDSSRKAATGIGLHGQVVLGLQPTAIWAWCLAASWESFIWFCFNAAGIAAEGM